MIQIAVIRRIREWQTHGTDCSYFGAEAVTQPAHSGPHSASLGCRRVTQSKERKHMTDEVVQGTTRTHSGSLLAAIAVAILLGLGAITWSYTLSNKLAAQQVALANAAAQNTKLSAALQDTDARLNVATDELKLL